MKVILVNRYFYPDESATSRMVTSLVEGLSRSGHRHLHVVTSRSRHDDTGNTFSKRERIAGATVHRVWTTRFGRAGLIGRALDYLTFHLALVWQLLCLARRGDICVVCTDPPLLSVSVLIPTMIMGARRVNWVMDLFPEVAIDLGLLRKDSLESRAALWVRDMSFERADMNIALTGKMAEYLGARGIPPHKRKIIHHWSDGAAIKPVPPHESKLRQEWGLQGKIVVGYSGNMGRAHEFATVLEAARRLSHRPDIVFLFVGGGYHKNWIEGEAGRLGLRNILMKPLQPRERLSDSLAASDVHLVSLLPDMEPYIVPSKFYGIAAAGRPTLFVGHRDGEIARTVARAGCGAAIEVGDGEGLKREILKMADSEPLRNAMGARARALFEAEFSEARGLADWSKLLNDLSMLPAELSVSSPRQEI
jgi:glycosyltransferase involved in cell wall biosynthesis